MTDLVVARQTVASANIHQDKVLLIRVIETVRAIVVVRVNGKFGTNCVGTIIISRKKQKGACQAVNFLIKSRETRNWSRRRGSRLQKPIE